jgi:hypothetical protein
VGSLCQLLEAGSLKAAAPATAASAPEQAGSRICRHVSRWSPAKRCLCCRRLCKVTSDCFPFQRQPLQKKLFPPRTLGKWGLGGNPRAFVAGRSLIGDVEQAPSAFSADSGLTGFQGGNVWTDLGL